MKFKIAFSLIAIFSLGYFLRVMYLPDNSLLFIYDQARDAIEAQNIISGDLKIQGPPASTPGLNHGVFWYYFLVFPNLISGGNPIVSAYWNALFSTATVFIVYFTAYYLLKNDSEKRAIYTGLLASFLFAVSFEASQYATWISNPTTAVWSVPVLYLGLWMWIADILKGKGLISKYLGPVLVGFGYGLSVQANIFLLYHLIPIALWLWIAKSRVNLRELLVSFLSFLVAVSSMILVELKFGFKGFNGVQNLLGGEDAIISSNRFGDFVVLFLNQIGDVYANNIVPHSIFFGAIFVISLISLSMYKWSVKSKKKIGDYVSWEPFLASWLFVTVTVVSVGGASTPFLAVGVGPAVSIIVAIYIVKWICDGHKLLPSLLLLLIVLSNLSMIFSENKNGQTLFALQKDMTLKNQYELVDHIYMDADGEEFSFNSLNVPLWIDIVWAYHFDNYAEKKFGYVPTWTGVSQKDQLLSLPESSEISGRHFTIVEPLSGMPPKYLSDLMIEEDIISQVVSEKNWGELKVQSRVKLENNE